MNYKITTVCISILILVVMINCTASDKSYSIGWTGNIKKLWGYENFQPDNRISASLIGDIDKDGILDIVVFDRNMSTFPPATNITTISGATGNRLWGPVFGKWNLKVFHPDITSDNAFEIIVQDTDYQLIRLNLSMIKSENGGILWKSVYPLLSSEGMPITTLTDYNEDGKHDFIIDTRFYDVSKKLFYLRLYFVNGVTGSVLYTKNFTVNYTGLPMLCEPILYGTTGDLNNDDVNDTVVVVYDYKAPYTCAFNGKTGSILWNVSVPRHGGVLMQGYTPQMLFSDFTGDGRTDVAYIVRDIANKKSNVTGHNGINGNRIFRKEFDLATFTTTIRYFDVYVEAILQDYTGDNIPDLPIVNLEDNVVYMLNPKLNFVEWTKNFSHMISVAFSTCDMNNDNINDIFVWGDVNATLKKVTLISGKTGKTIWTIDVYNSPGWAKWLFSINYLPTEFSDLNKDGIVDVVMCFTPTMGSGSNVTFSYTSYNGKTGKILWSNKFVYDVGTKVNKSTLQPQIHQIGDVTGEGFTDVGLNIMGTGIGYCKVWWHLLGTEANSAYIGSIYADIVTDDPYLDFTAVSTKLCAYQYWFTKGYDFNKDGINNDVFVVTKKGVYCFITPFVPEFSDFLVPIGIITIFLAVTRKKSWCKTW